ncbi:hypothetical protein ACJBU6_05720 [Exserohilum turcicum]
MSALAGDHQPFSSYRCLSMLPSRDSTKQRGDMGDRRGARLFFRLARFATSLASRSHTESMHPPAEHMRTSAIGLISAPNKHQGAFADPAFDRPSPCLRRPLTLR